VQQLRPQLGLRQQQRLVQRALRQQQLVQRQLRQLERLEQLVLCW